MMSNIVFATDPISKDWRAIKAYLNDRHQFLRNLGIETRGNVVANIDERDEMHAFAHAVCPIPSVATLSYFRAGAQIANTFRQVYLWHFGYDRKRKSLLDFASGYGRATRFLSDEFPNDDLWASDILRGAMEFQTEQIGVKTILSATDPNDFEPGQCFDVIWVGSLFTHLPRTAFDIWLRRLYDCLTPNGLLAFTVHDVHHLPVGASMPEDGFFFLPMTEIPSLDTTDYGATTVTQEFVREAIERCTGSRDFRRIPRAVTFQQDLYLVGKGELRKEEPVVMHTPYGYLEDCIWKSDNHIYLKGWALDFNPGHDLKQIQIFLNGKLIATPTRSLERPDIVKHMEQIVRGRGTEFSMSGWQIMIPIDEPVRPYSDLLLAKATSTSGLDYLLRCGTLDTMLSFDR